MINELAQKAIQSALIGKWENALEMNRLILLEEANNIDAMNRCAKAYFELGDMENAIFYCMKVLEIDPLNSIANKSITRYKTVKNCNGTKSQEKQITHRIFLEEPGRTKIVTLLNLGETDYIYSLTCGDKARLLVGKHRVNITNPDGKYIGRFPDDLASRLIQLIGQGSEYQVYIKSVEANSVKVIIRESKNTNNEMREPSFPIEKK
jgi:tetratricopeptide (TPR) repeat protein